MIYTFLVNMLMIVALTYIAVKICEIIGTKINILQPYMNFVFSSFMGIISVICMLHPFSYKGLNADLRIVPIFYATYIYGWKPGIVSIIPPLVYRLVIETKIVASGIVGGVFFPFLFALLLRKKNSARFNEDVNMSEIVAKYILFHLFITILFAFIINIETTMWLSICLYYTIFSTIALTGLMMVINDEKQKKYLIEKLREESDNKEKLLEDLSYTNSTLNTIIDIMPAGVLQLNTDGNIMGSNQAAKEILGDNISDKSLKNNKDYSIHGPNGLDYPNKDLYPMGVLRDGITLKDKEALIKFHDGREINILGGVAPIKNSNGDIKGAVTVFQDITKIKEIEDRLKKGLRINRAFQNAITEALILTSARDRSILSINKYGAKMFNLTPPDMVGNEIYNYFTKDITKRLKMIANEVKKTKKPVSFEETIKENHMKIVIYPIFDDKGDPINFAIFAQDITQLKKVDRLKDELIEELSLEQEKLSKKNEELKIADKTKDLLIANVSHELRTPLNIIMSYTEYLQEEVEGELNDMQMNFMKTIYKNSERLKQLIDDLLDVTILERDLVKFNCSTINLNTFIKNLTQEKSIQIMNKNIVIKSDLPSHEVFIKKDSIRLRQVIENIVDNAIKFTNKGYIVVALKKSDEYINIIVEDTGIGIELENENKVFEPFFQVDTSTKKKHKGVGLGLSIAKKITEKMGGRISVINNVYGGCTFTIKLPVECCFGEAKNEEKNICS